MGYTTLTKSTKRKEKIWVEGWS